MRSEGRDGIQKGGGGKAARREQQQEWRWNRVILLSCSRSQSQNSCNYSHMRTNRHTRGAKFAHAETARQTTTYSNVDCMAYTVCVEEIRRILCICVYVCDTLCDGGKCICVRVNLCTSLTALCDVADAAVYYDRYVRLRQLLLAQCVSSTPCCHLDGRAPAGKIQLPLSLYVQSSK